MFGPVGDYRTFAGRGKTRQVRSEGRELEARLVISGSRTGKAAISASAQLARNSRAIRPGRYLILTGFAAARR